MKQKNKINKNKPQIRKLLTGLGSLVAITAPIITVAACGSGGVINSLINKPKPPFKEFVDIYIPDEHRDMTQAELDAKHLTMIVRRVDLSSVIWYVMTDSLGFSTPSHGRDVKTLGAEYANIGDLSGLSPEKVRNKVWEANQKLVDWLNSINDWKYEENEYSWEVTSETLDQLSGHHQFSGGYYGINHTAKPSIQFFTQDYRKL